MALDDLMRNCERALREGRLQIASNLVSEALQSGPCRAEIDFLAGRVRMAERRAKVALTHFKNAIACDPGSDPYWEAFSDCIRFARPLHLDVELISQITACLRRDRIDTKGAELTTAGLLLEQLANPAERSSSSLLEALNAWQVHSIGQALYDLLLAFLELYRIKHAPLEHAFTRLRRDLLRAVVARRERGQNPPLALLVAMAIQCFNNEYAFLETDGEREAVRDLVTQLSRNPTDLAVVAAVAAYRPLHGLPNATALREVLMGIGEPAAGRLVQVQIDEPLEEHALKTSIPTLAPVQDSVSCLVRAQYEENPYPRWTRLVFAGEDAPPAAHTRRQILVAGCGTGQDPLQKAAGSPQSEIVALDLSLASLAYAARKARVYGITNVSFIQGDILDLAKLVRRFDSVICTGVLHHMREPEHGLAAIADATVPGGSLLLALYTESGRGAVVAGIALRMELGLPPTPEGIRDFRKAIYDLPPDHPASALTGFGDFYAMSECRDLVFHVQEHRFTLPRIGAMLERVGLVFDSFDVPNVVRTKIREMFPARESETSLPCWCEFEAKNPGVFGSMYQFIVRKPHTARSGKELGV